MKFQTLVLYLFDVYCVCFNSNQIIFKVKTEKSKTEKIRGIQKTNRLTQAVVFFRRHFLCGALLCNCSSVEREVYLHIHDMLLLLLLFSHIN